MNFLSMFKFLWNPDAAFLQQKLDSYRKQCALLTAVIGTTGASLWLWDYTIDPAGAMYTVWLRLAIPLFSIPYIAALLLKVDIRWISGAAFTTTLGWEIMFVETLNRLDGGMTYGIAGFMYFFIMGVLLLEGLSLRINLLYDLCIAAVPQIMGFAGFAHGFEQANYSALIWPAAAMVMVVQIVMAMNYWRRQDYQVRLLIQEDALRRANDELEQRVQERTAELSLSEEKYRRFVNTANEGIWSLDANLKTNFVNAKMAALLGYSTDEMLGHLLADFIFDEDLPDFAKHMEMRRCGESEHYECRFRCKDGSAIWTLVSAAAVSDDKGNFHGSFAMLTDITERRQAELNVALLNFALNNIHEAAFLIDEQARFHFVNEEACRILGYTREELLNRGVVDVDADFPIEHWPEHWQELKTRRSLLFEGRHKTKEERIFPVEINANFIEYAEQSYNLALVRDITERKRAEDALRLSSERLQLATRVANIGIWDWNIVNNELVWDESMYQLYGIRRGDFSGAYEAWTRTIHPEDKAYTEGEIQAALRGEREYAPEFRIIRADGTIRHIKANSRTIRDQDGKPLRMIGTNIDITESKRIQKAMQRSQSALEEAQRIGHIGSWDVDMVNDVLIWSDEIFRIWEIDKTQFEATFAAFLETVHPEDRDKVTLAYNQAITDKSLYQVEHRLLFPDGRVKYIYERGEPYFDEDGHPVRFIGTSLDITYQKQAEETLRRYKDDLEETVQRRTTELRLARDAAEAANKAKSLFLASMSHELRTPLNAILGFSSMMRHDPGLTDRLCEHIDIINRSGEHLLTLINDVLEIAKIEAGRIQLELAPFDLGGMVRDVCEMMQVRAHDKGLQLLLDLHSEFPRYIKGDEARLRQILVNLVGNAVKFTEQGGVTIRLGIKNNARAHLLIEVEDSGPGISEADLTRLFEPFVQLAEGAAQGGTGLGLSITHQFVQLMGGKIVVESRLGEGSLFRVELPLELASAAEVLKLGSTQGEVIGLRPGQPVYRILIVEDQYENQLLLARLMSDLGLETKVAENGELGVQLFSEWHPDLIWMDRRMPVMDGLEAVRRIRHLPGGDKVKIVAVTASVFKEQQPEMLQAGMDDLVRKPYRFNEIYACLARQLGLEYIYRSEQALAEPVPLTPEMLAILPPALRDEFKETLESLDGELIAGTIQQVGLLDHKLAEILSCYAEHFNYPAILTALDQVDVGKLLQVD